MTSLRFLFVLEVLRIAISIHLGPLPFLGYKRYDYKLIPQVLCSIWFSSHKFMSTVYLQCTFIPNIVHSHIAKERRRFNSRDAVRGRGVHEEDSLSTKQSRSGNSPSGLSTSARGISRGIQINTVGEGMKVCGFFQSHFFSWCEWLTKTLVCRVREKWRLNWERSRLGPVSMVMKLRWEFSIVFPSQ